MEVNRLLKLTEVLVREYGEILPVEGEVADFILKLPEDMLEHLEMVLIKRVNRNTITVVTHYIALYRNGELDS